MTRLILSQLQNVALGGYSYRSRTLTSHGLAVFAKTEFILGVPVLVFVDCLRSWMWAELTYSASPHPRFLIPFQDTSTSFLFASRGGENTFVYAGPSSNRLARKSAGSGPFFLRGPLTSTVVGRRRASTPRGARSPVSILDLPRRPLQWRSSPLS